MITLIPMAGAGSRFAEKGYTTPKPLLPVLGKPMVILANEMLPGKGKPIFVVRTEHIAQFGIDASLKKELPNCEIVTVTGLTEGQASTCLLAKNFINNDEELIIGASDNGMILDNEAFEKEKQTCDALVFSFRNNPTVLANPKAYGWAVVNENNFITEMKVKYNMPEPLKNHAVVGAFWFKKGKYFVEAAERMIAQNRRINNEFYVDEVATDLIQLGYKVKVFEIQNYICWGTPSDFETFNYWENFFDAMSFHSYKKKY